MRLSFDWRIRSLRWRLICLVSVVTLLILGIAGGVSYHQARHEVRELMDGQMALSAALLLAQVRDVPPHLDDLAEKMSMLRGAHNNGNRLVLEFLVSDRNGEILARSARGPKSIPAVDLGYANTEHDGDYWRSVVMATANGEYRIWVGQSIRLRDLEALEIATKTVMPLGLLIPVLLVLIYVSVRRSLKPLDDVATEVASRSPDNLQALTVTRAPLEIQPLVLALNHLLRRLGAAMDHERRFTADAAHELRTPLAAIRIQAQVALASTATEQHRHALHQVLAGTQRATRLVEQLLRLARLDPLAQLPAHRAIDLTALASTLFSEACASAPERTDDLRLSVAQQPVVITGDVDLLSVAVRNLIDNALKYTAPGCNVTIVACMEHNEAVLGVFDAGSGVSPEELSRLIERFYRGKEVSTEGSGLGLAIVSRIAELHDAHFELTNREEGGLFARLRWASPARG